MDSKLECSPYSKHSLTRFSAAISHFNSVVTVLVGKDAERFTIHEELLTSQSQFCSGALKRSWTESMSRVIKLANESPSHFKVFAHWLYFGKIEITGNTESYDDEEDSQKIVEKTEENIYDQLIRNWVLGDMLLAVRFKNAVIDQLVLLIAVVTFLPNTPSVNFAFKNTMSGSPLQRLLVTAIARYVSADIACLENTFEDMDVKCLQAVAQAAIQYWDNGEVREPMFAELDASIYYENTDDAESA